MGTSLKRIGILTGGGDCPGLNAVIRAVELLRAGRSGELVVKRDGRIGSVPISDVAGKVRTVPLDHSVLRAARAVGTSFGDSA